jgi:hypothetical protein
MAIEIVDLPIKNGGSFHSYVSLPEGNFPQKKNTAMIFCLRHRIHQLQETSTHREVLLNGSLAGWKKMAMFRKNMEKCLENYPMFGKPDFFKNCSSCSIF